MAPTPKTPKPKAKAKGALVPDQLSKEDLATRYGYAMRVIYADPELARLFEQAVNAKSGQWTKEKFQAELQNTNWWVNNNEYARKAFVAEKMGGADWEAQKQNARLDIQKEATATGATYTPEEMDSLVSQYLYGGWNESSRRGLLQKAMGEKIKTPKQGQFLMGASGNLENRLRQLANENGLSFSEDYYTSAARSVATGLQTDEDWLRDVQERAASMYPVYGDKIMAGVSVKALASPYMQLMAQEFDLDERQISLDDPYIRQALMGINPQGEPAPESLYDFQKKLRNDPRWERTAKAQNQITSVTGRVMQMFGLMGG